jgi:hypothetical protein
MAGRRFFPRDGEANGLVLVGEVGSTRNGQAIRGLNVAIDGGYAYVAGVNGLDVIDVSSPSTPSHIAHVESNYNDIKIVHGAGRVVAFVASASTDIIDITAPAAPVVVAQVGQYSHSIHVRTDGATPHLYLATYTGDIPVYDVSNPLIPVLLGITQVPWPNLFAGVHDLFVDNDVIYANYTEAGLVAFDVSGGLDAPKRLGQLQTPYSHASWVGVAANRRVVLHGDEGLTRTPDGMAFLRVLDGDPQSPTFLTELGRYQSRAEVGIHNFQLVDNKAYIAYYEDGVRVIDLSDLAAPREVAHYNTWNAETAYGAGFEGAVGISTVGGLIYVADSERGLLILGEQQ